MVAKIKVMVQNSASRIGSDKLSVMIMNESSIVVPADGNDRAAGRGVWRRAGHRSRHMRGPGARGCERRSTEVRPRFVEVRAR